MGVVSGKVESGGRIDGDRLHDRRAEIVGRRQLELDLELEVD